jgi:NDP-sugar pyrophosphorylase family protein
VKVAILAGGLATRLRPLTDRVPKSLVDVGGRPFAELQLALLRKNGFNEVVLCVGHLGDAITSVLGDGQRFGMSLTYVDDGPALLGTGGALKRALPVLGERFLVIYGDSYLDCDYQAVARAFEASGNKGLMTVFRNDGRWERSNVRYENGEIVAYDKAATTAEFHHVDYGLGAFTASAFDPYRSDRPFDLATIYQELIASKQLSAFEMPARFHEIGSVDGLTELRSLLHEGKL